MPIHRLLPLLALHLLASCGGGSGPPATDTPVETFLLRASCRTPGMTITSVEFWSSPGHVLLGTVYPPAEIVGPGSATWDVATFATPQVMKARGVGHATFSPSQPLYTDWIDGQFIQPDVYVVLGFDQAGP